MYNVVKTLHSKKTAEAVTDFFENLGLPTPQDLFQYTQTRDNGFIVFIDPAACLIRLTPNRLYPSIEHPHILQPLLQRKCGELRAEIFPGVATPVSRKDIKSLAHKLQDDEIDFYDTIAENGGYLPVKTHEFPRGIPVVIDMGACFDLRASTRFVKKMLGIKTSAHEQNAQGTLFRPLANIFAEAWPKDAPRPNRSQLSKAWALCAKYKKQGLLQDSWKQATTDYKNARSGSAAYSQLLQSHEKSKGLFDLANNNAPASPSVR